MNTNHSHAEFDQSKVKPKTPKVSELLDNIKSVVLASIDEDGTPTSSYAPFVQTDGSFQILVSFMARHTKNLRDRKKVSVMFIEDESASKQVYARHRLTIDSEASEVEKGSPLWEKAITGLKDKHGKIVETLESLEDFIMIDLKPTKGAYVNGFGSAYFVNDQLEVLEHRTGAHGQHNVDSKK